MPSVRRLAVVAGNTAAIDSVKLLQEDTVDQSPADDRPMTSTLDWGSSLRDAGAEQRDAKLKYACDRSYGYDFEHLRSYPVDRAYLSESFCEIEYER